MRAMMSRLKLTVNDEVVLDGSGDDLSKVEGKPAKLKRGKNRIVAEYSSPAEGDAVVRVMWSSKEFLAESVLIAAIWREVGYIMVLYLAGLKGIPEDYNEAARIDGASELQVFRHITVPSILPTIVVVTTYMVINALKVFDIVFVMGNAETNGTEVVAERMIRWFFISGHDGRAAAIRSTVLGWVAE